MILYLNSLSDINTHLLVVLISAQRKGLNISTLLCYISRSSGYRWSTNPNIKERSSGWAINYLNMCGGISVLTPQLYAALTVHTTTTSSVNTTTTSSVDTTIIVDC